MVTLNLTRRKASIGIQLKRIGHVGILVSDFERSFKFYTAILGCKVTSRRQNPDGSEVAFLRFDDTHHDFVMSTAPKGVDVPKRRDSGSCSSSRSPSKWKTAMSA